MRRPLAVEIERLADARGMPLAALARACRLTRDHFNLMLGSRARWTPLRLDRVINALGGIEKDQREWLHRLACREAGWFV